MIFIDNKYLRLYYKIIEQAKLRQSIELYTEKHHIIPRSLGGNNDADNIVKLSGREHYIAHLLLTKITEGKSKGKMVFALNSMMNRFNNTMDRHVPNSRVYDKLRKELSWAHTQLGRSSKHLEAISKAHTGKIVSAETRKRMSVSQKAVGPKGGAVVGSVRSEETRKKISESRKGITFSEEHRKKLSDARKKRLPK